MSRVVIVGGLAESLVNFRGPLIRALLAAGHEVVAMAGNTGPRAVAAIEALGVRFVPFPVARNGLNPLQDLRTFFVLYRLFRDLQPEIFLGYTVKPVIWGGLAARLAGVANRFALVTGAGYAFGGRGVLRRFLCRLVSLLYRMSLSGMDRVIFQNRDNLSQFVTLGLVSADRVDLVAGSGVDLEHYVACPFDGGATTFLLIARLLREKGICEYVSAARRVQKVFPDARFCLVGPYDPSPDGISEIELNEWVKEGVIEYVGEADDVRPFLAACHVYVLPSYYNEGIPRTLLEALAIGRPILTTEWPGCREPVVIGENGFLVPIRDVDSLSERMLWFIEHRQRFAEMGRRSRNLAEERFDVRKVNAAMLKAMGLAATD